VDSLSAYTRGLRLLPQRPEARIPVWKIRAPILLEYSESDSLGPSCQMARRIQSAAGPGTVQILACPNAGHASFGPPVAPSSPSYGGLASLGGTRPGNAFARDDSWAKIVIFLNANLRP
jgi:dienelactone hydrolase